MKFYASIFFVALLCLAGCSSGESKPPKPLTEAEKAVADSGQQFAFDLYNQLATEAKADENLFFSPAGLHAVLTMSAAGAAGETQQQMLTTLRLESLDKAEKSAYGGLLRALQYKIGKNRLNLACHLWNDKTLEILEPYTWTIQDDFRAKIEAADFAGNPKTAVENINRWAANETQGKIKEVVTPGDITPETRLVLANALYFHGQWAEPFKKEDTREQIFRTGEPRDNPPKVPLMFRTEHFPYYKGEFFQALALPYEGDRTEMIILLPNEPDGLPELESQISAGLFDEIVRNFSHEEVRVGLAKFKLEETYRLNETLQAMGIADAFLPDNADFSGISAEKLNLSLVLQKACVEVNEEGTTAAAVSLMGAKNAVAFEPSEFITDRPFIFAIYDRHTATVLFLGRFVSP